MLVVFFYFFAQPAATLAQEKTTYSEFTVHYVIGCTSREALKNWLLENPSRDESDILSLKGCHQYEKLDASTFTVGVRKVDELESGIEIFEIIFLSEVAGLKVYMYQFSGILL